MVFALVACSKNISVQWDAKAETAPRHHVLVGIPASAAAELQLLSELHPMGRPRARHLQADQLEGRLASVGYPQEQAGHELRDHGPRSEVSCCLFRLFAVIFCYVQNRYKTRMWASAQRDGRPAEYRWRHLFNATKFG